MTRAVEEWRLRPVVDSVFPLARGAEAYERVVRGEQLGKVVLDMAGDGAPVGQKDA